MAPEPTHARAERPSPHSEAIEDYAKAIYVLSQRGGGPVGTSELAERLGVTPSTASAMVKRLGEQGLVQRQLYKGVTLTLAGEKVALEVIRHHRLLEAYLSEALGMPWDRVHEEAEVLEHYISEDLERLIAAKLGEPSHDPHGDPIPGPGLEPPVEDDSRPLTEVDLGSVVTFSRVSDSDSEMLRYLSERGIKPGARLEIVKREPFEGPLLVETEGATHALGGVLAARMRVIE